MLRAYGFRIALFAIVGLLVGLVISLLTPPKYEAAIQILVDPHANQGSVALSPAEKQITDLVESTAPRTVQTQVEQLTGFGVLSSAAQQVAQERGRPVESFPELNLKNLQKSITVEAATESDLITLRVRLGDKELARDLASAIYIAFDEQNQQKSKEVAERAITLLSGQQKTIDDQLDAVDKDLLALRKQYNTPDIEAVVKTTIENIKLMEQTMDSAKGQMAASQAAAASLRDQLRSVPPVVQASASEGPNPSSPQLEVQLAGARASLAQLRAHWEDDAPQVKEQEALVKRYENEMSRLSKRIDAGKTQAPNPVYQNLVQLLADYESKAKGAEQSYATAKAQLDARKADLATLPEVQRKMMDLARRQDSLTRVSLDYREKLASLEASQRGRLTASTIVSPAIAFPDPVSPNYPLNLGAGLIAGLLLGLLSAFGTESRRSPIRSLSQLNRLTLEPAFRSIPELPFVPLGMNRQPDEVFVTLLGNFIRSAKRPYRIGVLGVDPDSGATVAASSMALGSAMEGNETLLVDTARENGVTRRLGLPETGSVVEANERLTILRTGGEELSNASGTFETIKSLEDTRSLTVIDLHPFKSSGSPMLYLAGLDECILLVRQGRTRTVDFLQAQQMLIDAGVPQVTVVLARAKSIDDDFTFMPAEPQAQALLGR